MIKPYLWRDLHTKHRIAEPDEMRWLPLSEMHSVGLPAPVKKLLESLSNQDQKI
jgi:adenine-specific DNA glycosylase